ncbi:MAG TPA: glycine--tRNA ligase [Verrucomicrobiae bacterium]|nr:glycine--tRNA ligase [Verrucomicrobiae bacterium]
MSQKTTALEDIVSLAKRRGFIYQGSEIYGGLAGTWDYGPLGVALKRNISNLWWKLFVEDREDMYGLDAAILMNQKVWQASGHTGAGFADPLVEDVKTKKRYRADHLLEENGVENPEALSYDEMNRVIREKGIKSPDGNDLSDVRVFNLMFETNVGPIHDEKSKAYLRPENAQAMFVNYRNIVDTFYPDLPFGVAQIGRAFRNEISPREFIFRVREFDLMEFEYFIHPNTWEEQFEYWRTKFHEWIQALGLPLDKLYELEVPVEDRAHYSKRTIDFEYAFPFGVKEIGAVAYRTDYDLSNHMKHSGVNMQYLVKGTNEKLIPHVIEPTFGLDRTLLAVLSEAYAEDEVNGEKRVLLKLPEHLAPVRFAVSPLLKNKPELVEKAREVFTALKKKYGAVMWDDNGNIGKRYRRQDEIGTPYCVVIDFQTLEDGTVTVRDRDTTEQTRHPVTEI